MWPGFSKVTRFQNITNPIKQAIIQALYNADLPIDIPQNEFTNALSLAADHVVESNALRSLIAFARATMALYDDAPDTVKDELFDVVEALPRDVRIWLRK